MLDAVTLLHSDVTFSTCCDEECTMKAINKKYYPFKRLVSTQKSYILKQTCSYKLPVCLSMYKLLVEIRRKGININTS